MICWFNPLVWFAVQQMRFERERACDDFVLANGTRPTEYATDLLEIVSSFGNSEKYRVALAMARRSQFEGRLLALLDPALGHKFLSRGAGAAVVIAALAMIIPVAAAHIAPQPDVATNLPKQRADALLRSAANIHSNYYVSEVLKLLASKRLIATEDWGMYLEAAQKVSSDYYRSEVLRALMLSYSGDPAIVERSILAAEKIGSDYYKLEVLRSARDRFKIEGPVRDAYMRVARTIQSDTYRNQALAGLVSGGVL